MYIRAIGLIALLCGCSGVTEVASSANPSGTVVAILKERNGGATTSFGYDVYLRSSQRFSEEHLVAFIYGATRSDCAYGVNLKWENDTNLSLEYLKSKSTPAEPTPTAIDGIVYSVALVAGVRDTTAPCGGMEQHF